MNNVDRYSNLIKQLLQEYASYKSLNKEIELQFVCDTTNHHYQIVNMSQQNKVRVYGCTLHLDIKDGKIWIQHNTTEIEIAE